MIRINLLKHAAKKRSKGLVIPAKVWIAVGSGAGVLCLAIVGFVLFSMWTQNKPIPTRVPDDDYSPSTLSRSHTIEEVVREEFADDDSKPRKLGILDVSYDEMSFREKVNYEINFAKNYTTLLRRTVPRGGFGLRRIKVSKFREVEGLAITKNANLIKKMIAALRSNNMEVYPKPATRIAKDQGEYTFTFACKVEFGLNPAAEFYDVDLPFLPTRKQVPALLQKIVSIANEQGLDLDATPRRLSADVYKEFRRYRYSLSGTASYGSFVSFVDSLYAARIPCGFESLRLAAETRSRLRVDADLLLTITD